MDVRPMHQLVTSHTDAVRLEDDLGLRVDVSTVSREHSGDGGTVVLRGQMQRRQTVP